VLNLAAEVTVKTVTSQHHLPTAHVYTYLGAPDDALNTSPWLGGSVLLSVAVYALALLAYRVIKARRDIWDKSP
jgi:uncharacterized MnhB-related membrane protein